MTVRTYDSPQAFKQALEQRLNTESNSGIDLAFADISPPELLIYPIEIYITEKLHAYTMPRARPNTRVKTLRISRYLPPCGR